RNGGPGGFGNDGALREDQKAGLRIAQRGGELIGGKNTCIRKNLSKLRGRSSSAIGGGEARLRPDHRGGYSLGMESAGDKWEEKHNRKENNGGVVHGQSSHSAEVSRYRTFLYHFLRSRRVTRSLGLTKECGSI